MIIIAPGLIELLVSMFYQHKASVLLNIIFYLLLLLYYGELHPSDATTSSDFPHLHIVANHKSGVFESTVLTQVLCNDFSSFHRAAVHGCSRIKHSSHGLHLVDEHPVDVSPNASVFVHAIRHPLDMLISGYVYHIGCNEGQWTRKKFTQGEFSIQIPYNNFVSYEKAYCYWLREMRDTGKEEEGLEKELYRTLHASDGLGKMLQDMEYLEYHGSTVFNLCMSTVNEQLPALEEFVKPWSRREGRLILPDKASHHSDRRHEIEVLDLALKVIQAELPYKLVSTFPCRSKFYSSSGLVGDYIHSLNVNNGTILA